MAALSTDRIEKQVLLAAPRARVWQALTDSREFGRWFGVRFDGPFVAGEPLRGVIAPTEVDRDVARAQEPYSGKALDIVVDRIEPQRLFSFRWHPHAVDPAVDYSAEPMTLVTFTLEEVSGGIRLTVSESGFDGVPLERRARAFAANDGGWAIQVTLIERHLAAAA